LAETTSLLNKSTDCPKEIKKLIEIIIIPSEK
jgi:hypothetical protein